MINQISAILIVSEDPESLAQFYTRAFGLKFSTDQHGGGPVHYGGWLGSAHVAILPVEGFSEASATGAGGVKIAFDTLDFDGLVRHLEEEQIALMYPPKVERWAKVSAIRDPDGNVVEILQPCDEILQSALVRTRSINERVQRYLDSGRGWQFKEGTETN